MKKDEISEDYIQMICRLYDDIYDDRIENTRPPTAGEEYCEPGDEWKPGITAKHKSLSAFQRELSAQGIRLSTSKIKKILVTGGLWTTERSREIQQLFKQYTGSFAEDGYELSEADAVKRISQKLGISTVSVSVNLPYYHVVYNLDNKTSNAKRCEKYKKRKQVDKDSKRKRQSYECFICGIKLDSNNSSDEHILLNALGGHLHSPALLCKKCNSLIGSEYDDELSRELNYAASYLNVPRQRGKNQVIHTSANEKYNLLPGGKPELKKPIVKTTKEDNKGTIEFVARNEDEAKKILKNLAKKYPQINVDEVLHQMKMHREYLGRKISFNTSFHANKMFPSIIKSAIEYYLLCGGIQDNIRHLLPLLLGEGEVDKYCKYFYPEDSWFEIADDEIMHMLYIKGSSTEKMLYGYVSYFGIIQCIVLLNDSYSGPEMECGYAYNVMTRAKREIEPRYGLSRNSILEIIKRPYTELWEPMLSYGQVFMRKAENYRIKQQWELFLRTAWDRTIGQYPEGTMITGEMMRELTNEFSIIASPWLAAQLIHQERS